MNITPIAYRRDVPHGDIAEAEAHQIPNTNVWYLRCVCDGLACYWNDKTLQWDSEALFYSNWIQAEVSKVMLPPRAYQILSSFAAQKLLLEVVTLRQIREQEKLDETTEFA